MIRNGVILLTMVFLSAGAVASIGSNRPALPHVSAANVTVIEKNQDFPMVGPLTVEPCAKEDCSDVPS